MGNVSSYLGRQTDINNKVNYKKYGWKIDSLDKRDHFYTPLAYLGKKGYNDKDGVDLRKQCPGVYNQLELGSCTANAIAAAYEFDEIKQNENNIFVPSRLFIYYNERNMENTVSTDSGASIRDGIKSINRYGVCTEQLWPYDISNFTNKPSDECYTEAKKHISVSYKRISQDLLDLKACLEEGFPFVFGFVVYESFETEDVAKTGMMTMPEKTDNPLGGHAVMAVGYDDSKKVFIVRNSWGSEWGDKGYFYMPYKYITDIDLCSDFWTVRKVRDIA